MTNLTNPTSPPLPPAKLSGGEEISMQVFQAVYNEITGKSEKMAKDFDLNFQIDASHLNQLYSMLTQAVEQYRVVSQSCSISVYHHSYRAQHFSSFERFNIYDQTIPSPTTKVVLEFAFLLHVPKHDKPQHYEIRVELLSGITIHSDFTETVPVELWDIFPRRSGHVSLKFVDYMVGQNLMNVIDRWFTSLDIRTTSNTAQKLNKWSKQTSALIQTTLLLITTWAAAKISHSYLTPPNTTLATLSIVLIWSATALYILHKASTSISSQIKIHFKKCFEASAIILNTSDKKAVEEFTKSNRNQFIKGISKAALSILYGVITTIISHYLPLNL